VRARSASGGTGSERGARAVLTYPPDERSRATGARQMSLNYLHSTRILKIRCLQVGMFFYCIAAFLVIKVGDIIRCFTLFSMLSWSS